MKKRYKIIRVDSVDGRWFYPQRRTFFGRWECIYDWVNNVQRFRAFDDAVDFLECNDIFPNLKSMTVWEGEA